MGDKCTVETFLKDVENHEMKIIQNQGGFRHILYRRPDSGNHYFCLTTWPGHLCISGDMGTYVFTRLDDMFEFFRSPDMKINPCYWHGKMVADSRFSNAKKFSEDLFETAIKSEFRRGCLDGVIALKNRRDVWESIKYTVLGAEGEQEAHRLASDFESNGFEFADFWENDLKRYSFHFIWCLYAIVYGINEFDKIQYNDIHKEDS